MKEIIQYTFIVLSFILNAQERKTIYYNDNENVVIIFPDAITNAIPGNNKVSFGFDRANADNFGLLRGRSTNKTNLLVFTNSGKFYNFNVEYKKTLEEQDKNHFVTEQQATGTTKKKSEIVEQENNSSTNEKEKIVKVFTKETVAYNTKKKDESSILYNTDRNEHYKKFCSNEYGKKSYYKRYYTRYGKIKMKLLRIVYNRNELYFVLEIENNSGVDYEMNLLNFSKIASKPNKDAAFQSINLEPLFIYNDFETIKANDKKRAIYVFKKFGVNNNKILNIETNELKGERNLALKVFPREINNPL